MVGTIKAKIILNNCKDSCLVDFPKNPLAVSGGEQASSHLCVSEKIIGEKSSHGCIFKEFPRV